MAKYKLDDKFVKSCKPGTRNQIYYDNHAKAPKGFGLRVTPAGGKSWVLNYYINGKERRLTLKRGFPDWGPKKARIEAGKEKTRINAGIDPLGEREAELKSTLNALSDRQARSGLTLGALLEAYVGQLKRDGKRSHRAVDTCVRRNVEAAFPTKWNTSADDLEVDDFLEIVAALTDAGKLREAAKLRSYLRAAYAVAIRSRTDAMATQAMRQFKLRHNPVSDLTPISGNIQARERVLSLPELRAYYRRITALPDPAGAVLRFHLLTGGQRLEQLFRLTSKDLDGDKVTLRDGKGRRRTPRPHVVPLLPEALDALAAIGKGPFLVSFSKGISPATDGQLRTHFKLVSAAMVEAGEATEPFTPGDIRRTVETRLAAAGVTSDVLAQLLSHGLGGVQQRHYQRHNFMAEKTVALTTLRDLIAKPGGRVVTMKQRAKK